MDHLIRKVFLMTAVASLVAACGGGGSDGGPSALPGSGCDNTAQKQFVLDNLYYWYLWNNQLPAGIDINDYASPEELIQRVTETYGPQKAGGGPVDVFSFINSAQADQQFFGEGKFEGFGFSWRWADQARTDFRITRVFGGSPIDLAGIGRGDQITTLDGRAVTEVKDSEGISAFFDANDTITFGGFDRAGTPFSEAATKAIVTIDPIPQHRIIDIGGGVSVGYFELSTFISTADSELDTIFGEFAAAGVNDVIIDLRYNGGGLVSTAELLGDYLGGLVAENLTFSSTEFNADRAAENNSTDFFSRRGNSLTLSRLVVIASRGTASASELVTNGLIPHADVAIVGDRTFGKPVGQIGLEFCDKIMRPTAFRKANADGDGDYFDGLPLSPGCAAADDLSVDVGAAADPNMVKAIGYLQTGACPVTSSPGDVQKADTSFGAPYIDRRGPPHRELIDAY